MTTDFVSRRDEAQSVAIQADGKIVVAGLASISGTGDDFALARYEGLESPQVMIELIIAQA